MVALQLLPLALLVTALMLIVAYFMRERQHVRHAAENEQWLQRLASQLEEGVQLAGALSDARNGLDERVVIIRALVTEHKDQLDEWRMHEQILQDINEDLQAWGSKYPAWVFDPNGGGHAA